MLPRSALLSCLFLLAIISCKIVKVDEKKTFSKTRYDYASFSKSIEGSQIGELQKKIFLSSANKIINTDARDILSLGGVTLQREFFKLNDTLSLEYFIFEPKGYKKTGIYFQGNGTSILSFADKIFELSSATRSKIYVLNYRGYGRSGGIPSFKTQFEDNSAFVNFIRRENKALDFSIGYSLGSVFATYAAVEYKLKELYLLAPFSNTAQIFRHIKKQNTPGMKSLFRPFIKVTADDFLLSISNTEKIKQYNGRLTVFHGTGDNVLPYKMGKELFKQCPSNIKEFISLQGGHEASFEKEGWDSLLNKLR